MADILQWGPEGWIRDGVAWQPDEPFYAVMGDPIAHSLSPRMHNAGLRDRELDHHYLSIRISVGQLRQLKESPEASFLAGFNVTAPLKEGVSALCDGRTDQARDLGAVNTVRVEDGKWMGHNTDSGGCLSVLSQAWPVEGLPEEAVVLGAGGSGLAAVDALVRWGVPKIIVQNRSATGRDRMNKWVTQHGHSDRVEVQALPKEEPGIPTCSKVWVCCVAGGVPVSSFLPSAAGEHMALFLDLRYGDQRPDEEPPMGFQFSDGKPVLMMQGGLSFAWWFGPPIPWQAMRDALG